MNMDFVKGGINDELAAKIGLINISPSINGKEGRIGNLAFPEKMPDFLERLKKSIGIASVGTIHFDKDALITEAAVFCGSPDDEAVLSLKRKAGMVVVGELKHDRALAFEQSTVRVAVIGHYASEKSFKDIVARLIKMKHREVHVHVCQSERDPVSWIDNGGV